MTISRTVKGKQFGSVYCSLIRLRLVSGERTEMRLLHIKTSGRGLSDNEETLHSNHNV